MWQNIFPLAEFGAAHSLPVTEHLPLMNADNERVSIASSIRHTTTYYSALLDAPGNHYRVPTSFTFLYKHFIFVVQGWDGDICGISAYLIYFPLVKLLYSCFVQINAIFLSLLFNPTVPNQLYYYRYLIQVLISLTQFKIANCIFIQISK